MKKSEQYRQFADTLAAAARDADPATHDILLETAAAWRAMALTAERPANDGQTVVDFAAAARRLRSA